MRRGITSPIKSLSWLEWPNSGGESGSGDGVDVRATGVAKGSESKRDEMKRVKTSAHVSNHLARVSRMYHVSGYSVMRLPGPPKSESSSKNLCTISTTTIV